MMRRKGFTLLELLISATLFASISVMVVGVIATTASSQQAGARSQIVSDQLQRTLGSIETEISRLPSGASLAVAAPDSLGNTAFNLNNVLSVGSDGRAGQTYSYQYKVTGEAVVVSRDGGATFTPITDASAVKVKRLKVTAFGAGNDPAKKGAMIEIAGTSAIEKRKSEGTSSVIVVRGTATIGSAFSPTITNISQ